MRIDVLTLFPGMFDSALSESILKRAQTAGKVRIRVHNIRDEARDRHKTCDDRPFGGGPGMLMKAGPVDATARRILKGIPRKRVHFVYLSPQGAPLTQSRAGALAAKKHLVILCGRYEGVDDRVRELWVDEEISIGDYVLSGGELAAMVLIDAVVRLVPGVLGNAESKNFESFSENLLEYPQYTRPEKFRGLAVPPVLLSGNHKAIAEWRRSASLRRTRERRPDLYKKFKTEGKTT